MTGFVWFESDALTETRMTGFVEMRPIFKGSPASDDLSTFGLCGDGP